MKGTRVQLKSRVDILASGYKLYVKHKDAQSKCEIKSRMYMYMYITSYT